MKTSIVTRRVPVELLKPAKYNPRLDLQPGDAAYEKIKRSLNEYGYVDPLVWFAGKSQSSIWQYDNVNEATVREYIKNQEETDKLEDSR